MSTRRGYSLADEALLRQMWAEGASCLQIALALGRWSESDRAAIAAISSKARKMGLSRRGIGGPKQSRTPEFAARVTALWQEDVPLAVIAERMGLSMSAISYHVQSLGLPPRRAGRGPVRQPVPEAAPVEPAPSVAEVPPMATHPFWTPRLDALILQTRGHYAEMAALAARIGKSHSATLQRWHQLRAA